MIQALLLFLWMILFPQAWVPRWGPWILRWVAWNRVGVFLDARQMVWEFRSGPPVGQKSVSLRLEQAFLRDRAGRWRAEAGALAVGLTFGRKQATPEGASLFPRILGWQLSIEKGEIDFGRSGRIRLSGALDQPVNQSLSRLGAQARWDSESKQQSVALELSASGSRESMQGDGRLQVRSLGGWVPRISAPGCRFRVQRHASQGSDQKKEAHEKVDAELVCPVQASAELRKWRGAPAPLRAASVPVRLNLKAGVSYEGAAFRLSHLQVSQLWATVAGLELSGQGEWRSLEQRILFQTRLHSADFGLWVSACEREACEVPAPFHVLRGPWHLAAEGEWRPRSGLGLRVDGATRWEGAGQRLNAEVAGTWDAQREGAGAQGKFDVRLKQLRLALPPISILAPPRILPDTRIRRGFLEDPARERAGRVEPGWGVSLGKKPGEGRVELLSNLGRSAVGVDPRLEILPGGVLQGTIDLDPFPLSWMRRDARVEHFRFELSPEHPEVPIQGRVRFFTADYRVDLRVSGSLEEPEIHLESDPPVPEEQLWSVLLFGRTFDDLDSWETESVGDTRAAVADRALSLAALYLLTATPVEGLTYDPSSGAVGLRLKLAEGTSLRLGTDSEQRAVWGLRKRVGRSWTLMGGVGEDRPGVGQALLEWSRRY